MPFPAGSRKIVRNRRTPLTALTVFTVVAFLTIMVCVGPWDDSSESAGVTSYEGSGTEDNPWVFGNDLELRAYIKDGTLTVYQADDWTKGFSDIPDFTSTSGGPWNPSVSKDTSITKIAIMDGIQTVGTYAFYNLSLVHIVDLGMSDITSIKSCAFGECFTQGQQDTVYTSDYVCVVASDAFKSGGMPFTFVTYNGNAFADNTIPSEYVGEKFWDSMGYLQYDSSYYPVRHLLTYEVGVVDDGSDPAPAQRIVRENKMAAVSDYSGTKEGFVFGGWEYNGETYQPGHKVKMGTDNMLLTAVWNEASKKFTVTFDSNGGDWTETKVVTVEDGTKLDLSTIGVPTRASYEFDKWISTDGEQTHGPHDVFEVHTDMDFIAVWKEPAQKFTVTFDLNGGSWSLSDPFIVKCESGSTIELGEIGSPTKESYAFGGWCCNGTTYPSDAAVTVHSNMTFEAVWNGSGSSSTVIPIFPGDEQEPIEVVVNDEKDDSWLGKDGKTVLVIAIVVAIIAELAVMSVSKRE